MVAKDVEPGATFLYEGNVILFNLRVGPARGFLFC